MFNCPIKINVTICCSNKHINKYLKELAQSICARKWCVPYPMFIPHIYIL